MKDLARPISTDNSASAKKRHEMVIQCIDRLQHFAFRAEKVNSMTNRDVVVVCIQVDSVWRPLVDKLMPSMDWQQFRDMGLEPVARGTVMFPLCEDLARKLPSIADVLMETPTDGFYKCIALDEGGCTVYEIEPKEQKLNYS